MNSDTTYAPAEIPSTRAGLRLSSEVCEALRAEAFAGLKALPKRGAEVGGLLTHQNGELSSASVIDGFELFPCQHLYGPSYRLSPSETDDFLARQRSVHATQTRKVAGIFRSSTREAFQVTPEDEALASDLPESEIVLIKPFLNGNSIFRVFHNSGGGGWREFEEFEVRCESIVRSAGTAGTAVSVIGKPAQDFGSRQLQTASLALVESPASEDPGRKIAVWRTNTFRICAVLFLLAGISAVSYGVWKGVPPTGRSGNPGPPAEPGILGLQAISQGETLRVTWNPALRSVREGTAGNLRIDDGGVPRDVALDKTQLVQGSIYYTPASDDVTFRLSIQTRGQTQLSAVARILTSRKNVQVTPFTPGPVSLPPVTLPKRKEGPIRLAQRPLPPKIMASKASPPRQVAASSVPNNLPGAPTPPSAAAKVETPPISIPPLNTANLASGPEGRANVQSASVQSPVETAPRVAPVPEPVPLRKDSAPQVARVAEPAAPFDLPVPARAVKTIMPSLTHSAPGPALLSAITVSVEVSIDKLGNVVEAHALRSASQYWSGKAVEAAKQWKFQPAMLHGQTVPSLSSIDFRFSPSTR